MTGRRARGTAARPPSAMHGLHLPDHIHFCEVGGGLVFLDLAANRYFMLPQAAEAEFCALLRGEPLHDPSRLLDAGLVVCGPGRPVEPVRLPCPDRSLLEEEQVRPRAGPARILMAWWLIAAARRALAAGRLPRLVAGDSDRDGDTDSEALKSAVRQFLAARKYVPAAPGCLHDSLALRAWLARRRLFPRLVIGVKLHPFGAHCWLQHETMVLNDTLEGARGFQPVLVA